jgi:hypothetical protein
MADGVYEQTVALLQTALDYAYNKGSQGGERPGRADAARLTWQIVSLASREIQGRRDG